MSSQQEKKKNPNRRRRPRPQTKTPPSLASSSSGQVLLLHGNRQTGQLLLGRLEKIRKRLRNELNLEVVAPDAPFSCEENGTSELRTWWNRVDNDYQGLDQTLEVLQQEQGNHENLVGIMGFSQGARLAHLLALLHTNNPQKWFPKLQFVLLFAGYDAPLPDHHLPEPFTTTSISVASLHVWGLQDPLILPEQSEAVTKDYLEPQTFVHDGKHHVPTKAPDIQRYMDFIQQSIDVSTKSIIADSTSTEQNSAIATAQRRPTETSPPVPPPQVVPDEEAAAMQQEEVQALEAIFPEEMQLKSSKKEIDYEEVFDFPIVYHFILLPAEDINDPTSTTNWPSHPLTLQVTYPYNYPLEAIPKFHLLHDNNSYEFPSNRVKQILRLLTESATLELGMPSVLSCIYAVKEYLDAPPSDDVVVNSPLQEEKTNEVAPATSQDQIGMPLIPLSSPERIFECNLEGLDIAERILQSPELNANNPASISSTASCNIKTKGGSWTYTIGLVGKPSAGKSTFFNAATAFSRQRGDTEGDEWAGAGVSQHPFTTIDPNIGYCLIPAPPGSCPEDDIIHNQMADYGSTHGRDPQGQRFLPVLLKDVAGLVPGAYQGRGRGNQFLNDLTDATVLIHVVDASGTADAQGNKTMTEVDAVFTNPLDDLAWIRNELVEWVYSNVTAKWDTILRKGRTKVRGLIAKCRPFIQYCSHLIEIAKHYSSRECSLGTAKGRP
jgi:predicted esterase